MQPVQLVGMDSRQLATQQQREEYDRLQVRASLRSLARDRCLLWCACSWCCGIKMTGWDGGLVVSRARTLLVPAGACLPTHLQKQETRRVTLAGDGSGSLISSDYMCGRCGGRSCSYLDSGRRDSGKCETWGSKDGQGSSRIVTCQGCGQRWEVDDV